MAGSAAGAVSAKGSSGTISSASWLVVLVVSLFFMWGGITSLNDVLIPKLKGLFQLSYARAMLIQFAFFTAYAIVSLPAGGLVARLGYGRGIAVGLGVAALGCLLFVPAASTATYGLFLAALFILAGGITILQVAANPLIANLGSTRTSHSRLTFAQAFNSLGTTIAPWIGAHFILSSIAKTDAASLPPAAQTAFRAQESAVIGHAYLGLATVLALIALVFWIVRNRLGAASGTLRLTGDFSLLRRPRLGFGVAAIFLYVGAEVTIGSLLANYLMQPSTLALDPRSAGEHIAFYWGGAMVGRFIGAGVLRLVSPGKVLAGAAVGAGALCLLSAGSHGALAGWSLIAVGLLNSIMFPTIFSLALEGLGEKTPEGSGLLCMAIVGGALVPVLGGAVADATSLAVALTVPAVCYAAIAGFGWYARRHTAEA
ncbi:MAG: sugar transporter [Phenylobacterium sp.]|nr:sugar transporter [Phenylobacterium sp.]